MREGEWDKFLKLIFFRNKALNSDKRIFYQLPEFICEENNFTANYRYYLNYLFS